MSNELERLRSDLDVMQEAMGAKLPFTWKDVRLNLLLAPAGLLAGVLAWAIPANMVSWSVVPILLAIFPALPVLRWGSMTDRIQAIRRREHRQAWIICMVLLAFIIPYLHWQQHLGSTVRMTAGGACVFFGGVFCTLLAILNPARRYYLGAAIPLIVMGLLLPGESQRQIAVNGGIACVFAGLMIAAIQSWQLRLQERA